MRYALVTVLLLASATTTQRAKQRGLQTPLRVRRLGVSKKQVPNNKRTSVRRMKGVRDGC